MTPDKQVWEGIWIATIIFPDKQNTAQLNHFWVSQEGGNIKQVTLYTDDTFGDYKVDWWLYYTVTMATLSNLLWQVVQCMFFREENFCKFCKLAAIHQYIPSRNSQLKAKIL